MSSKKYHIVLLIIVLSFWTWSGINPQDTRLTWVLETVPFMIALPVMLLTYKRFRLSNLTSNHKNHGNNQKKQAYFNQ